MGSLELEGQATNKVLDLSARNLDEIYGTLAQRPKFFTRIDEKPQHEQIPDQHPLWNAHRNFENGRKLAEQDSELMKNASNLAFVEQINKDSHIQPQLEWLMFGGALATKGVAKAFVLSHIGHEAGSIGGKLAIPGGIALGVAGAAFLTYELSDYLENSGRSEQFEKRLLENKDSAVARPDDIDPSLTQQAIKAADLLPEYVSRQIPSLRDIVDSNIAPVKAATYHYLLNSEVSDHKQELVDKALAHGNLNNQEYVDWAKKESAISLKYQVIQDSIFTSFGIAGGFYAGTKLGLGRYGGPAIGLLGAAGSLALSHLKTAAEESSSKATLFETRLIKQSYK